MKDDHYCEIRLNNNLADKRSREKRRLNDIVLGKKYYLIKCTNNVFFSFLFNRNKSC